jgi:hypothetical protein
MRAVWGESGEPLIIVSAGGDGEAGSTQFARNGSRKWGESRFSWCPTVIRFANLSWPALRTFCRAEAGFMIEKQVRDFEGSARKDRQ